MTEQIAGEQVGGASVGLPTPTFEEPSAVSSPSTVDADALVEKLAAKLMPTVEKLVQSQKDKRIAKLEKALNLSELEELGVQLTPEQRTELRFRELKEELNSRQPPVPESSKATGETQDSAQVSAVINDLKLDARTPEVVALLSGRYRNLDHFRAEAQALKLRQLEQPNPTLAQAPVTQGKPPEKVDANELAARVRQWQKNPSAHKAELDAAYKELGWK